MRVSEAWLKDYKKKQKRPAGKKEKAATPDLTEAQARYYAREAVAWAIYKAEEEAARRECIRSEEEE